MGRAKSFFARFNEERWSMADYATMMARHIEDYEQNLRRLGLADRLYLSFLSDHYTRLLVTRKTGLLTVLFQMNFGVSNKLCRKNRWHHQIRCSKLYHLHETVFLNDRIFRWKYGPSFDWSSFDSPREWNEREELIVLLHGLIFTRSCRAFLSAYFVTVCFDFMRHIR